MEKISRQITRELIWLLTSFGITIIFATIFFGFAFWSGTIEFHFHDARFEADSFDVLWPLFFLVVFVVYFVRELKDSFRQIIANRILLIAGFLFIVTMTFLIEYVQYIFADLRTDQSATSTGPDNIYNLNQGLLTKYITNIFIGLQAVVLIMVIFSMFWWGKNAGKRDK